MENKLTEVKLSELVLDWTMYPRTQVSEEHVTRICEAIKSGVEISPILADSASLRVVDGFHRYYAYRKLGVDKVSVLLKDYLDEAALYEDAGRLNASHGRPFSTQDCRRFVLRAEELGLSREKIAEVLHVTREKIDEWAVQRASYAGREVPVKRGLIKPLAGRELTKKQVELNKRWGGMNAAFYANQLIAYLEADVPVPDELAEKLDVLTNLWLTKRGAGAA